MGGNVDRGGSREGKGKSLRTNKVEIHKVVKKGMHSAIEFVQALSSRAPEAQQGLHVGFDCGCQLLSRQFDRDSLKVLQRAIDVGIDLLVAFTTDFEKGDQIMKIARENSGRVYAAVGLHTDNLKRNNDKLCSSRLDVLRERALRPEAVAIMAGLDLSRDVALRYAQEKVLQQQMEMALEVGLPMLLYHVQAATELAEKISEFRESGLPGSATALIAIFDFSGSDVELQAFLALDCFIILTGRICTAQSKQQQQREEERTPASSTAPLPTLSSIPQDRLLIASNAPFHTPQSIDDAHMREGRNEPSNLPYVLESLAKVYNTDSKQLAVKLHANTLSFFNIPTSTSTVIGNTAESVTDSPQASQTSQPQQASTEQTQPTQATTRSGNLITDASETYLVHRQITETHHQAEDAALKEASTQMGAYCVASNVDIQDGNESQAYAYGVQGHCQNDTEPAATTDPSTDAQAAIKAQPRNFVAEHQALLAARGVVEGPRVVYACRVCRSVLFSEHDLAASAGHDRSVGELRLTKAEFRQSGSATANSRNRQSRDEQSGCSMHFLSSAPSWFDPATEEESGHSVSSAAALSGKLSCPSCHVKLGKWACLPSTTVTASPPSHQKTGKAGARSSTANTNSSKTEDYKGIQCSCGVVVPAPAFAILRARLDIVDSQMDIATAINSSLQLYEAEADAGSGSSSDGGGEGGKPGRKSRTHKMKVNNTSNFSSFRNKTFGVPVAKSRGTAAQDM